MFSRAALSACVVLCLAASAHGQVRNPRAAAMPQIRLMPIQLQGTVAGVRPGVIAVSTAAGETWALKIPAKTEVRVSGTAELDVLRVGMYVRFIAPVDKRRSLVQEKVDKLVIFSPSQEQGRMPGVFHAGQEGGQPAAQPNPGVPQGRNPGVPPKAAPAGQGAAARDTPAADVETFDIRGRITVVKGRWLTVYVRNTFFRKPALRIELTEKPVINVDVNTYTLAKPGDKISAQGVQIAPQIVQAMQVAIELSEPLGNPSKKPRRPTVERAAQRSPKGGDDKDSFEVAQQMEQGKPQQNGETPSQEKPNPQDERGKKIVEFLKAKPEEIQGKSGVTLSVTDGEPIKFSPCKQLSGKEVLGRFGLPSQVQTIKGSLPLGEGGQQKEIEWQLWAYGQVLFFVDEADTTRYLAVLDDKKKQQQEKQEEKDGEEKEKKQQQQP